MVCDLTDADSRSDLISRASELFGPIDILVNNAAGSTMRLPSEVSTSQRNFMFDLNVNAPIELAQQALPGMRERGAGWILNISSRTCEQPVVPYRDSPMSAHVIAAYGATKAALNRYSAGLAHEVAPQGICINTLAPENIVLTAGADYVRDIASAVRTWQSRWRSWQKRHWHCATAVLSARIATAGSWYIAWGCR